MHRVLPGWIHTVGVISFHGSGFGGTPSPSADILANKAEDY